VALPLFVNVSRCTENHAGIFAFDAQATGCGRFGFLS
jgi:hypothetical protein